MHGLRRVDFIITDDVQKLQCVFVSKVPGNSSMKASICKLASLHPTHEHDNPGAPRGGKGGVITPAPNHYGGAEWLWTLPRSPNNVTSTFFNIVHLLPKDLKFEHGETKLLLAQGVI